MMLWPQRALCCRLRVMACLAFTSTFASSAIGASDPSTDVTEILHSIFEMQNAYFDSENTFAGPYPLTKDIIVSAGDSKAQTVCHVITPLGAPYVDCPAMKYYFAIERADANTFLATATEINVGATRLIVPGGSCKPDLWSIDQNGKVLHLYDAENACHLSREDLAKYERLSQKTIDAQLIDLDHSPPKTRKVWPVPVGTYLSTTWIEELTSKVDCRQTLLEDGKLDHFLRDAKSEVALRDSEGHILVGSTPTLVKDWYVAATHDAKSQLFWIQGWSKELAGRPHPDLTNADVSRFFTVTKNFCGDYLPSQEEVTALAQRRASHLTAKVQAHPQNDPVTGRWTLVAELSNEWDQPNEVASKYDPTWERWMTTDPEVAILAVATGSASGSHRNWDEVPSDYLAPHATRKLQLIASLTRNAKPGPHKFRLDYHVAYRIPRWFRSSLPTITNPLSDRRILATGMPVDNTLSNEIEIESAPVAPVSSRVTKTLYEPSAKSGDPCRCAVDDDCVILDASGHLVPPGDGVLGSGPWSTTIACFATLSQAVWGSEPGHDGWNYLDKPARCLDGVCALRVEKTSFSRMSAPKPAKAKP